MIKHFHIQENLHLLNKIHHNEAFASSKDSTWLNCIHIGLELVSPKNFHGSTSSTLNSSISSPRRSYKIYIINAYNFKFYEIHINIIQIKFSFLIISIVLIETEFVEMLKMSNYNVRAKG